MSALVDEKPLSIDGSVGPIGKGFQMETIPLDLKLTALEQLTLGLKGAVENPLTRPGINMNIEIAEFSPRKLMAALGQDFPVETTDPKTLDRVALKTHVKGDAGKVSLTNGELDLDQSQLSFSATASDFSRPNLKFDLNLDQIDLDRYLPPPADQPTAQESAPQDKGSQKKPDYEPLRRLILDGTAKIGGWNITFHAFDIQRSIICRKGFYPGRKRVHFALIDLLKGSTICDKTESWFGRFAPDDLYPIF